MGDRPPAQSPRPSATRPTPTVEFDAEPELTEAVARAMLALLQRSSIIHAQGPDKSTNA